MKLNIVINIILIMTIMKRVLQIMKLKMKYYQINIANAIFLMTIKKKVIKNPKSIL